MHLMLKWSSPFLPPNYLESQHHISPSTKCTPSRGPARLSDPIWSWESHDTPALPLGLRRQPNNQGRLRGFGTPHPGQIHTQKLSHVLFSLVLTQTGTRIEGKMARHPEGGGAQSVAPSWAWNLLEGHGEAHPSVIWHLLVHCNER